MSILNTSAILDKSENSIKMSNFAITENTPTHKKHTVKGSNYTQKLLDRYYMIIDKYNNKKDEGDVPLENKLKRKLYSSSVAKSKENYAEKEKGKPVLNSTRNLDKYVNTKLKENEKSLIAGNISPIRKKNTLK
jgi:hypothetical protein